MASGAIRNRVRVGGSGFTVFTFMGQPLYFCQQVSHTAPTPVGPGPVAIQPMDEPRPIQVITPAAAGMGSLVLNLYELYNSKPWDLLGGQPGTAAATQLGNSNNTAFGASILNGAQDIADIFVRVAEVDPKYLSVVKIIRPPFLAGLAGKSYYEVYHNCVITNITDSETVEIGTMEVLKQVTIGYTRVTRSNGTPDHAGPLRDTPITAA